MKALIVGGDRVQAVRRAVAAHGLRDVQHWDGRKDADRRRRVPRDLRLVVVLYDRINHRVAEGVRAQAERGGIPVVYSRHSAIAVSDQLRALGLTPDAGAEIDEDCCWGFAYAA